MINKIDSVLKKHSNTALVCIDGPAASGKSTAAEILQEHYGQNFCNIIHADDFFLPQEMKTRERLSQPGGNINYEALLGVILDIKDGGEIKFKRFDCRKQQYLAAELPVRRLNIVEGVYSAHPALRPHYDLIIMLSVNKKTQLARLKRRETPQNLQRYLREFLPLEAQYFNK